MNSVLVGIEDADIGRKGLWLKTQFTKEGPYLKAVTYCVGGGRAECFTARVDLRPIERALKLYHLKQLHGGQIAGDETIIGFLGGLKKAAKKIGKSKLTKMVYRPTKRLTVAVATGGYSELPKSVKKRIARSKGGKKAIRTGKAIIRSKTTGAIVTAAAVAYPPVGVPALAAYTAANTYLSYIDKAGIAYNILKKIDKKTKVYTKLKAILTGMGKKKASKMLAANPKLAAYVKAGVENQKKIQELKKRGVFSKLTGMVAKKRKIQMGLKKLANRARAGDVKAKKAARIIKLVHRNRERLKHTARLQRPKGKSGLPGLLITDSGRLVKGRFIKSAKIPRVPEMLYQGAKALNPYTPGDFSRVSGGYEVGCNCTPKVGACIRMPRVGMMPQHVGMLAPHVGARQTSAHLPY